MDQRPLVTEEIEAGADFVARFDKYMPVKAAFWLKPVDDGDWCLYIASDAISDSNIKSGYRGVLRVAGDMQSPYIDPFQVKLIGANHRLALAVLELHDRYPGKLPIRYQGSSLGGMTVEGAYLYAPPVSSPIEESPYTPADAGS